MLTRTIVLVFSLVVFGYLPLLAEEKTGPQLLSAWGCLSCHRVGNYGGTLAPELTTVGKRLNAIDIRLKLHPLPGQNKDALMPTYPEMPDDEVRVLSNYLAALK